MTKNPSGRRARWIMTLMEFSPYITQYRRGKLNGAADAISRLFPPKIKKDTNNTVAAITRGQEQKTDTLQAAKDIGEEQQKDSFCGPIMTYLSQPQAETPMKKEAVELSRHMAVYGGVLWHIHDYQGEARRKGARFQMVVPYTLQASILKWAHEGAFGAHIGRDKALEALLEGYWWKNMAGDLANYIKKCTVCQQYKDPGTKSRKKMGNLQRPMASQPWQVAHLDACTVRSRNTMIFVDQFSGYVELQLMTGPITGKKLSEAFITCVICRHSTPAIAIYDNVSYQAYGCFPQVLRSLGVNSTPVSVYHPQEANGRAERVVATVKKTLRTLAHENATSKWTKLIPLAAFVCNTSHNKMTGFKPFFLCTGREPILPGHVNAALTALKNNAEVQNPDMYVKNLEQRILTAFETATGKLKKKQEEYTHQDLLLEKFRVGEEVMMLAPQNTSTDNLRPKWRGPYKIARVISPAIYRV
ncbi:unnamed protein product, partial [Heterosigma akashiwo]